jgi:hypothetical protein
MSLDLPEAVRAVLRKVEEISLKPFHYVEKRDLTVPVRIRLAAPDSSSHELYYNAGMGGQIDYAIVSRCGHILRLYGTDAENRYVPVANKRTMMAYLMELDDEIHKLAAFYGKDRIRQMVVMWYEGLVYQLTRMPTEIMINKWICGSFPFLRDMQLKALNDQRAVAVMSISPDVGSVMPSKIYRASNIMNYVYFKVLEDFFQLDLVAPYHSTVFIFEGSSLARITENDYLDSHEGDRAMIDQWAGRLALGAWFEWKPLAGETCLF